MPWSGKFKLFSRSAVPVSFLPNYLGLFQGFQQWLVSRSLLYSKVMLFIYFYFKMWYSRNTKSTRLQFRFFLLTLRRSNPFCKIRWPVLSHNPNKSCISYPRTYWGICHSSIRLQSCRLHSSCWFTVPRPNFCSRTLPGLCDTLTYSKVNFSYLSLYIYICLSVCLSLSAQPKLSTLFFHWCFFGIFRFFLLKFKWQLFFSSIYDTYKHSSRS